MLFIDKAVQLILTRGLPDCQSSKGPSRWGLCELIKQVLSKQLWSVFQNHWSSHTLFLIQKNYIFWPRTKIKGRVLNRCIPPKIHCRLYRDYVCSIHLDFRNCTKNSKGHLVFSRVSKNKFYFSVNYKNHILHPNLDSLLKLQAQISMCI